MEMSEFLAEPETPVEPEELDVQKAVVESLAADKAEQDEKIIKLREANEQLLAQVKCLQAERETLRLEISKLSEQLTNNAESGLSTQISILDRDVEIKDNFVGETRDHILEAIRDARNIAEKEGRLRRAQVLEGVLLANEPAGILAKRREELDKLFINNSNILSGEVIAELNKLGISYKNGEEYLLPAEIMKRTY